MTCHEVEDLIEAIAAGDEPVSDAMRAHLEGCVSCAASLARARHIEGLLATRPAPDAPPAFAAAVSSRIRQERWRAEQHVDRLFNVAVLVGVAAVVGGIAALLNVADLANAVGTVLELLRRASTEAATQAAPAASTYMLSAALLITTMLVWRWAEGRQKTEGRRQKA